MDLRAPAGGCLKVIAEIKKSAKQGQMGAVKVMAKDLIRTQMSNFKTLKSTQAMGEAMKAAPASNTKVPQAEFAVADDGGIDSDLQARLDNLRRM
ncbi:hypothetical protein Leryth_009155 [Lithospermum erythrorhizon]|nr:hypothetical protein Leryth_009155 [Lithospermum erythrorhizon]